MLRTSLKMLLLVALIGALPAMAAYSYNPSGVFDSHYGTIEVEVSGANAPTLVAPYLANFSQGTWTLVSGSAHEATYRSSAPVDGLVTFDYVTENPIPSSGFKLTITAEPFETPEPSTLFLHGAWLLGLGVPLVRRRMRAA